MKLAYFDQNMCEKLGDMVNYVGDLMSSTLDSRSNGLGFSPGQGTALCSRARHFTLTVPLFTQVYRWVLMNLLLGLNGL